jgi:hypothetical protein
VDKKETNTAIKLIEEKLKAIEGAIELRQGYISWK